MNNLHLTLSYMTSGELRRIGATLRTNPDDNEPGWFVRVSKDDGYINALKWTRISPRDAVHIALRVDHALGVGPERAAAAVRAVNQDHARERAKRREQAAAQLAAAQRTLAQLDAEEKEDV